MDNFKLCKIYTTNDHVLKLTGLGNELENLEFDKNHPAVTKNFENAINKKLTSFYTFRIHPYLDCLEDRNYVY